MCWKWLVLAMLGIGIAVVALFDIFKKRNNLSSAHAFLIVAGGIFLALAILQPKSIKYKDVELAQFRDEVRTYANQAKDSAKLSLEAAAVSIWNQSRFGGMNKQEEVATEILKEAYGDKTDRVKHFLQHEGLLSTPAKELESVPKEKLDEQDIPLIYKLKENAVRNR